MWGTLIESIWSTLESMGYWGIMIGLMIEVIPSEIVLAYGGYLVSQNSIRFGGAVLFGTIGGTLAQLFLYWLGKYGGRPFVDRYGKYLLITERHVRMAEQWFARYGAGVVFGARFIPVVRHAISIPAGMAGMPLATFLFLTVLAVLPWSVFFIYIGYELGENWMQLDEMARKWIWPLAVIAVAGIVGYIVWKNRRAPQTLMVRSVRETRPFHFGSCVLELDGFNVYALDVVISAGGILVIDANGWKKARDASAHLLRIEYALRRWLEREGFNKVPVVVVAYPDISRAYSKDQLASEGIEVLAAFPPNRLAARRLAEMLDAGSHIKAKFGASEQEQIYRHLVRIIKKAG